MDWPRLLIRAGKNWILPIDLGNVGWFKVIEGDLGRWICMTVNLLVACSHQASGETDSGKRSGAGRHLEGPSLVLRSSPIAEGYGLRPEIPNLIPPNDSCIHSALLRQFPSIIGRRKEELEGESSAMRLYRMKQRSCLAARGAAQGFFLGIRLFRSKC